MKKKMIKLITFLTLVLLGREFIVNDILSEGNSLQLHTSEFLLGYTCGHKTVEIILDNKGDEGHTVKRVCTDVCKKKIAETSLFDHEYQNGECKCGAPEPKCATGHVLMAKYRATGDGTSHSTFIGCKNCSYIENGSTKNESHDLREPVTYRTVKSLDNEWIEKNYLPEYHYYTICKKNCGQIYRGRHAFKEEYIVEMSTPDSHYYHNVCIICEQKQQVKLNGFWQDEPPQKGTHDFQKGKCPCTLSSGGYTANLDDATLVIMANNLITEVLGQGSYSKEYLEYIKNIIKIVNEKVKACSNPNVTSPLILSIILSETGFNTNYGNSDGIMQTGTGDSNLSMEEQIQAGIDEFSGRLKDFDNDVEKALFGYNRGKTGATRYMEGNPIYYQDGVQKETWYLTCVCSLCRGGAYLAEQYLSHRDTIALTGALFGSFVDVYNADKTKAEYRIGTAYMTKNAIERISRTEYYIEKSSDLLRNRAPIDNTHYATQIVNNATLFENLEE